MAIPVVGVDDGVGGAVSSAASMTCCVFFAVIYDAGDYSILPAYRACGDARRRVETGAPIRKGGAEGIPFRLPIFRYALLWCAAHSVTHLMCAPSFAPSTPRLPKNILRSPTSRVHAQQIVRTPATGCSAVLAAVTQSVTIIYLCLLKESDTLRFTLSPQPVIARNKPGNTNEWRDLYDDIVG